MKHGLWLRRLAPVLALAVISLSLVPIGPASADEPVNGEGSTWSFPAIQQWQANMAQQGETVNYDSVGSTAGRVAFYNKTTDFAVSEIPFQPQYCSTPGDPTTCVDEQQLVSQSGRTYGYMPIVAGGTSIGYNLQINGSPFRNLQLNVAVLAGIFTGTITNWDNAAIAALNPGVHFPNLPIHPVGRSDGSGTSYQFTAYMAAKEPNITGAFCATLQLPSTCFPTSQYPAAPFMTLANGSDGVANDVTASYNNGAIGYAEYAYWIERGAPVAFLENTAGQFRQPTAVNVAVALTKVTLNPDHTQNLLGVYNNPDPRTYPMSSYSYMIVPTNDVSPMDTGKGATLSKFILYLVCQGQQDAKPLGYSPLPPNLIQIGYDVNNEIPGGVKSPASPTPANCNNPTLHGFLNQVDAAPTAANTQSSNTSTGSSGGGGNSGGSNTQQTTSTGSSGSGSGTSTIGSGVSSSTSVSSGGSSASPSGSRSVSHAATSASNGTRGASQLPSGVPLSGSQTSSSQSVSASPVDYGKKFEPYPGWIAILLVIGVILLVALPPGIWAWRRRPPSTGG